MLPAGMVVLERGWLSSNNIVLMGKHGTAVVDSGYWTHADQTSSLVAACLGHLPLDSLANTHLHSDHCGGNFALQARYPAAKTFIPPGLADAVRTWDPVALSYAPTGQHCPRFRIDGALEPGTSVRLGSWLWEVHAAPGHDPNSVILFERESRTLISADALWENGFGIVFQELEGERAFDEVADTLDLIERLDPAVVIPGHGTVFAGVAGALARARSRLDAYVANPRRHAAHAAKVLIKFKLLEVQCAGVDEFRTWAEGTQYLEMVRSRWYSDVSLADWISLLLEDLIRGGAIAREGDQLVNC
jgi:glyoxylase-like metal-dependent hydrolase (beta-lactamase superfamily II)